MTKQMLEESIKENLIKAYKSGKFFTQYGYMETEGIMVAIAEAMNYKIVTLHFRHGRITRRFENAEEREKVLTIMKGMQKTNLLKQSKNGNMYKLAYAF